MLLCLRKADAEKNERDLNVSSSVLSMLDEVAANAKDVGEQLPMVSGASEVIRRLPFGNPAGQPDGSQYHLRPRTAGSLQGEKGCGKLPETLEQTHRPGSDSAAKQLRQR